MVTASKHSEAWRTSRVDAIARKTSDHTARGSIHDGAPRKKGYAGNEGGARGWAGWKAGVSAGASKRTLESPAMARIGG
jgi:hypothetical protein